MAVKGNNESWRLRPNVSSYAANVGKASGARRPSRPTGSVGMRHTSGSTSRTCGMSFEDKANIALSALNGLKEIIQTVSQERRLNMELRYKGEVALKALDVKIRQEEENTKRILGQYEVDIARLKEEARLEADRIAAARQRDADAHQLKMVELKNRHERDMRMLDLIEKAMDVSMSVYAGYRIPEMADVITIDTLDRMNSTILTLSESLGSVGTVSQSIHPLPDDLANE